MSDLSESKSPRNRWNNGQQERHDEFLQLGAEINHKRIGSIVNVVY